FRLHVVAVLPPLGIVCTAGAKKRSSSPMTTTAVATFPLNSSLIFLLNRSTAKVMKLSSRRERNMPAVDSQRDKAAPAPRAAHARTKRASANLWILPINYVQQIEGTPI